MKIRDDATPLSFRFQHRELFPLESADSLRVHPGYLLLGNPVDVAGTSDGDVSRAAGFSDVGTRNLVFAPVTVRVEVAQEMVLQDPPLVFRTVPLAVRQFSG